MVSQSFYAAKHARHTQAQPHSHPKVTLRKEACTALKFQRAEKSCQFKDTLNAAWSQIDNVMVTVATTHHKTFHCVQHNLYMGWGLLCSKCSKLNIWNTFCWKKSQEAKKENCNGHGKEALQSLVHDHKDEYRTLTQEEQEELLQEFTNQKETKISGECISMRSKINDITQTLKVVENELNSLNSRTGAEIMSYMTCGTTDLPLHTIVFMTPGVNHFMDSIMGIDTQDFISKMEQFAIQGIQGTANNHQKRVLNLHGEIQAIIMQKLREVTGESKAKMQWADYFCNVVNPYQVAIKGWPEHIPFTNLSNVSSALPDLKFLLDSWKMGAMAWNILDDEELAQLHCKCDEKINSGQVIESR
ncbi:uncharacterized protein EDB91DRAFT_1057521 [Suillus paluster]|uniref:uncharacterized protein n=1 Tax=Suillus paluster TaxID=48578 RepID=UPI001B880911|nr:uncharacterized protein EDB91DRAFT_1057521 [Suillus paluster]KAG1733401.1 hypothetical protein EDB91DRAFT_1057521 [Suillus paluster]